MQTMTENRFDLEMFPKHRINPKSKWYMLEKQMPWRELEELLAPLFEDCGRNAIPVKHIIGALIVQTQKNLSDRETIEVIMETTIIQYRLRNLKTIETKLEEETYQFDGNQLEGLETCKTVYDQQQTMYETKIKRHVDRIMNLDQPHIHCIVRAIQEDPMRLDP